MCRNIVIQHVPKGHGYKAINMRCGDTSIHGASLFCDECKEAQSKLSKERAANMKADNEWLASAGWGEM